MKYTINLIFVQYSFLSNKFPKGKKISYGIKKYLITLILRNITIQLECISANAAGTSAIPVTDK